MVKPFYYVISCIALHFLFGWLAPVLLTLVVGGIVFERYVPLKTGLTAAGIHIILLLWTYGNYTVEVQQMTYLVDEFILKFIPYTIPIITILIPVFCYSMAGFIAEHGLKIYYKISVPDPRDERRNWNQSF